MPLITLFKVIYDTSDIHAALAVVNINYWNHFRLYMQLNTPNYSRDDSSKIEQKLGLLETQMNAKILQMQNKKAKLFKMKKNHDCGGGGGKIKQLSFDFQSTLMQVDRHILSALCCRVAAGT